MYRVGRENIGETSLAEDYVLLCDGHNERSLNRVLELVKDSPAVNMYSQNDKKERNLYSAGKEKLIPEKTEMVFAVYTDVSDAQRVISQMINEDLEVRIELQGIFAKTLPALKDSGIQPYSAIVPLGLFGKSELLAKSETLEICTMCGHGRVEPQVVEKLVKEIREGIRTPEQASIQLAKLCYDGILNPRRTEHLLTSLSRNKRLALG